MLLAASAGFYISFGLKYFLFIAITSVSIYCSALYIESLSDATKKQIAEKKEISRDEKKLIKKKTQKKQKAVMIAALFLNFGLLAVFKYSVFATHQFASFVGAVAGCKISVIDSIIAPIGISFYTFQTTGYLLDIYWKKYKPERNIFKMLLFTSFFPQIVQGPIGRFDLLSEQLFRGNTFEYKNFSYGCQRMMWGFFKKIVVAETVAPYVATAFSDYASLSGENIILGAFLYSLQIYADFSGYMDIVCGFTEILGIRLSENFERPYFSKSVAEYWRRWHITLGTWFKDYLYFPIALSKPVMNAGKKARKTFGDYIGKNTPAVISLVVVWFTTGLWHGASWQYIVWGGLNGFFIIFSMLFEPLYEKTKNALRINSDCWKWRFFQTVRSFILITMIKVFPEIGTFSDAIGFFKCMVTNLKIPTSPWDILLPAKHILDIPVIALSVGLMLAVSLIQRKQPVRDWLSQKPIVFRWLIYISILFGLILFGGSMESVGGFLYAQF